MEELGGIPKTVRANNMLQCEQALRICQGLERNEQVHSQCHMVRVYSLIYTVNGVPVCAPVRIFIVIALPLQGSNTGHILLLDPFSVENVWCSIGPS